MKHYENISQVVCPLCGYRMPVRYKSNSNVSGVFLKCKNNKCKTEFELKIVKGSQVL